MMSRRGAWRAAGVIAAGVWVVVAAGQAPATEARPVRETLHGKELVDPYRWLEGDNSSAEQMGRMTEEVARWTDAQNAYTRSVLDSLPGREALESRLRELMEVGSVSAPTMEGKRYFYTKREGTQAQPIVYVREGHAGEPRTLLDPSKIDASGLTTIAWYAPSQDGRLMAFGMFRAGDENSTLYVLDVDRGEWLAEEIPGKVGSVAWTPDSSGFFYRRLRELDNPYSAQIKFHRLGTHHSQDPVLFEQYREGPLAKTWGPWAGVDRRARWMALGYWTGTKSNDLWIVDLERWRKDGTFERVDVVVGEDARSYGQIVGDTMYMFTTLGAPNGRVVAVDLRRPGREHWREVIPERPDAVLTSAGIAKGIIVADYEVDATSRLERFGLDGKALGELPLPGVGSAGVSVAEDRTEAFLTFTSYNEPTSIYRVDLSTGTRELWERPDVPVDPSLIEVKQVRYTSKDGTEVPMFIVHRKGLALTGDNPTILYGYGGFNISMTPSFSATMFPWYEAGGVYAVACLRGGSEYGEKWHRAGMLESKQNVFDDFAAAAEWLIANKYTRPERLGIAGGSNGGLLTGALVTQRPDLFRAAIVAVPLLDMIRFQSFLMASYWVGEYGSSENAEQFRWLIEYSPYHNIKPGTRYPAVFLTAGENDTRVHPMHARKMAARLQAATASDPTERPVLLWVDRDAGHGQGKPLNLRIRDVADGRIFMMWQLGMLN